MKITKIKIKRVLPKDGLVAFASCVVDDCLYLGNIAIFSRLGKEGEYRLVCPVKEVGGKQVALFYPLTKDFYYVLEQAIVEKLRIS